MPKVFISAGDPSGDVHAARLMEQMLLLDNSIEFFGIGGRNMAKFGLKSLAKIEEISVVGFWEVAKKYRYFKQLLDNCKALIRSEGIDIFIPVDYPGFNLNLARYSKNLNIPVVYFIAPQLWAWGKNRAEKLAGSVDKLLVVFPFEQDYFKGFGIDAEFIGHPLMDNPLLQNVPTPFSERENILALLPGSRKQEIERHLGLYASAAIAFKRQHKDFRIILAKAGDVDMSKYQSMIEENNIEIETDSLALMSKAKIGIVKTGTSNLEAALAGMPFSMVYRTSLFSYLISKRLINLDYVSIVNILSNRAVIDELIQKDANEQRIVKSLEMITSNETHRDGMLGQFGELRNMLGGAGASERAARVIAEYL